MSVLNAPAGYHVFRDSASWNASARAWWMALTLPPPEFDFTDHVLIGVSYGQSACYYAGGEIERMTRLGNRVLVDLADLIRPNEICQMLLPKNDFAWVAKEDLPEGVRIEFARGSILRAPEIDE